MQPTHIVRMESEMLFFLYFVGLAPHACLQWHGADVATPELFVAKNFCWGRSIHPPVSVKNAFPSPVLPSWAWIWPRSRCTSGAAGTKQFFFYIFFGKWEDLVIHAQIPQAVIPTCRRATKASGEHAIRCASRNFDRKSLLNTPFETFRHSMFAIASFWFMCAILFRQLSFFPSAPTRFNMNSHPARTLNRKLPIKLPNLRYRMPKTVCEWVSRACMPK